MTALPVIEWLADFTLLGNLSAVATRNIAYDFDSKDLGAFLAFLLLSPILLAVIADAFNEPVAPPTSPLQEYSKPRADSARFATREDLTARGLTDEC